MLETGAVFGGEHSAHYYFRDNFRADSGVIAALMVLGEISRAGVPLSELRAPFERYAQSGEINTRVDDPARGDRAGRRRSSRRPTRTASTASPSTSATGGSTCARATPSRCCGSTSRPATAPRATGTPTTCSRWCATHQGSGVTMALDPKLLEILACPEDKGPLLYFEDESSLYNPRLHRRYDGARRHPDHADRRGGRRRRRRARAAGRQGRRRRDRADVRGLSRGRRLARLRGGALRAARAARRRARARPGRSTASLLPDAADDRQRRRARDGWLRHRRRRGPGGRHRDAARPAHRAEALPHARVHRPAHARVRGVVLG